MKRIDWAAASLSLTLSVLTVLGASYDDSASAAWFAGSRGGAISSAIAVVLLAIALYLVVSLLFRGLDRMWDPSRPAEEPVRLGRRLLAYGGVVLAGWLPWLLVHYPGNIDSDTMTQRLQWIGYAEPVNHHPWFDTMVFGWFWGLGGALGDDRVGLFAYLVLQEIATAAGVGLAIAYLGRIGLARCAQWALTVVAAVFPVFALAPSVMSKDAFANVFWLPTLVFLTEIVRTRGAVLRRPWVSAGGIAAITLLVLAKRTNVYLLVICAVVLLFVVARGVRLRLAAGAVGVLVVTVGVWPMLVLPAIGVKDATSTDIMTVFVQQTARTVQEHGDELPEDEREAIDAVLRYDGLGEAYDPTRSDNVKGRWDADGPVGEKLAYLRVWFAELLRYPGTYLSATAANTYEYFSPVTPMTMQMTDVLDRYVDFWESRSYDEVTTDDVQVLVDGLSQPQALDGARETANGLYTLAADGNPLFSKAIFSSWIPLLLLAWAIRRRSGLHVLATIPMFVTLLFLVASPVALPRYILPMVTGAIFAVGLMMTPARRQEQGEAPLPRPQDPQQGGH
ncbi:DUF6020 family protein [Microbacterium indicum]|uniref:DUF6020 family protein n=1 Tax=Microbacterium indicum TaxID=358100 RepID=UPI00041126C0|nr:DUF6020 family protein [Microbacterium indicum]